MIAKALQIHQETISPTLTSRPASLFIPLKSRAMKVISKAKFSQTKTTSMLKPIQLFLLRQKRKESSKKKTKVLYYQIYWQIVRLRKNWIKIFRVGLTKIWRCKSRRWNFRNLRLRRISTKKTFKFKETASLLSWVEIERNLRMIIWKLNWSNWGVKLRNLIIK